jgi:hypothetical protein
VPGFAYVLLDLIDRTIRYCVEIIVDAAQPPYREFLSLVSREVLPAHRLALAVVVAAVSATHFAFFVRSMNAGNHDRAHSVTRDAVDICHIAAPHLVYTRPILACRKYSTLLLQVSVEKKKPGTCASGFGKNCREITQLAAGR